jgi:hypothetical protein
MALQRLRKIRNNCVGTGRDLSFSFIINRIGHDLSLHKLCDKKGQQLWLSFYFV